MTTTIQIRVDVKMKKSAQAVFENMGLDLSSGVKLYLSQVILEKGLPFTPRTENGYTPAQEAQLLKELVYTEKHGKRYRSGAAALKDILG